MSWWNPWGEVRRLRTELALQRTATNRLLQEHLTTANTVDQWRAKNEVLSGQLNMLIREKNDLRNQLRQAHIRDPKTGRIHKQGVL